VKKQGNMEKKRKSGEEEKKNIIRKKWGALF